MPDVAYHAAVLLALAWGLTSLAAVLLTGICMRVAVWGGVGWIVVAFVVLQVVGLVDAVLMEPIDSAPRQLLRELAWRRLLVNALAVRTAFWRRGIGRQLLGAAEAWGRERGARVAVLDTYVRSAVSVPFYEHGMGYRRQSLYFSKSLEPAID